MSVSSSDKNMCLDRLSALPDDILCYILSFLEMKEASITCLVSKRWQFLWTKLPDLRFNREVYLWNLEEVRKFVNRVDRTLAICSRNKLERFEVNFDAWNDECISFDIDVWIQFAIEKKVKKFSLLLSRTGRRYHTSPQMMFSNPSWTSLALRGLIMAPPETIEWPSLTTLYMEYMDLDEDIFEKIFSGCPVLTSLDLVFCWGFNRLKVSSPSLHRLAIRDVAREGNLEILAPHLRTFSHFYFQSMKLCLKNIKSLVRAESSDGNVHGGSERDDVMKLIESTRHVKMLKLKGSFMEDLFSNAPNLQLPQSTRECLEIHADYRKKSVPGIVGLLKSSPNLETLVIHGYKSLDWDGTSRIPASIDDLNFDLFHLKTRAIILERMEFGFEGIKRYSTTPGFHMRIQELLSYPRVSQRAVHFIIASNNGVHFSSLQPCC